MKKRLSYLETSSLNPYFNLAFEEYLLKNRKDGDLLLLWQNENTVVIGMNQNAEEEIDHAFVRDHGIRVVRRSTGGGAVYHDLGNLNYSFITDAGADTQKAVEEFSRRVVRALCGLGLNASAGGRNDILVEGCKVSGTAQRIMGDRFLHHGTLLFDSNLDMIAGALHADPLKFQSKSVKSVRSRVENIRTYLSKDMTIDAFWQYLKDVLIDGVYTAETLSVQEMEAVKELAETKYSTWEWNYGRAPAYTTVNRQRYPGGTLEVRLNVKNGVIAEAGFYGDYMSLSDAQPLREALCGCPYREEAIFRVLQTMPISEYFGSITIEEVLQTMFFRRD